MSRLTFKSILFVSLFFVSSCSSSSLPSIPDIGILPTALNRDLGIIIYPALNSFKIGDPISLTVRLNSQVEIETSSDANARIFLLNSQTKNWTAVPQVSRLTIPNAGVFATHNIILSLNSDGVKELDIILNPALQNESKPVTLLIFVTGNILHNGTASDQRVGAYITLTLKP